MKHDLMIELHRSDIVVMKKGKRLLLLIFLFQETSELRLRKNWKIEECRHQKNETAQFCGMEQVTEIPKVVGAFEKEGDSVEEVY